MDYMAQALSLARLALGQVSPNPAVGAIIVNNDEVIGQGYTQPPGSDHAEIAALKQAGERACGGVMYVTLEPCCHHGRTPPCTRAIIASGIREVHLATLDTNRLVSGRGKKELEEAGIKVYSGEHEAEARRINEAFTKFITGGIPFVTAKFAMSLDGKIATRSGDSRWITGEAARKQAHYLRYTNDAVMVGVNTVLADDPQLTVRCNSKGGTVKKQPLRVIVDSNGRTPPSARVFTEPGQTVLALCKSLKKGDRAALTRSGAQLLELPPRNGQVDLRELLKALGKRDITSVLVEGGGCLLGSLFDSELVDKVIAFIAPLIIGGKEAGTAVAGRGVDKLTDALRLDEISTEQVGEDLMICGYVSAKKQGQK
ncbi:MAG: bifunctional diaminohydroxyphosphoribosylaminopyrimidine deaminase/5-amino-6-(5-phosphoribosylamino)uracil reductase RibD [Dehalococcoidales bacterium]|nr:bifunctional diaminohydroxyphosphoribosylaminopyrimidine deaminase/5-amino-6-(5-phosphoribosylamino)uracil reductase RibD [Dehalococcoidales bacterium]